MLKLTDDQWNRIRHHFPAGNRPKRQGGRPPVPAPQVLDGVLWILKTRAQRHMLPQCYPNYKTVYRRVQTRCRPQEAGRPDDRAQPEEPDAAEDPGRTPTCAGIDGRWIVLRVDPVDPARPDPVGVRRREFLGLVQLAALCLLLKPLSF